MRFSALAALISVASAVPTASLEARTQVLSDTIDWPTALYTKGNIAYQWQITPGSGDEYTIQFFNTAPLNSGAVYTYKAGAVGTGSDGTSVSKTLSPYSSASFTVQKSGIQIQCTIDTA